jgi:primosomal protein N'
MHRMHLLLRAPTAAMLSEILNRTEELDATVHGVQIAVDVDPVSML